MKSRRPTERLDDPLIQLQLPGINDVAQVEEEKPPVLAQLPSQPPLLMRVTSTQVEQEDGGGQVLDFYSDEDSTFDLTESTVTRQPCQRPPMFENVRACGDGNLFAFLSNGANPSNRKLLQRKKLQHRPCWICLDPMLGSERAELCRFRTLGFRLK